MASSSCQKWTRARALQNPMSFNVPFFSICPLQIAHVCAYFRHSRVGNMPEGNYARDAWLYILSSYSDSTLQNHVINRQCWTTEFSWKIRVDIWESFIPVNSKSQWICFFFLYPTAMSLSIHIYQHFFYFKGIRKKKKIKIW